MRGEVGSISHYWNVLPSGQVVDLTIGQFGTAKPTIQAVGGRTRTYVLSFPKTQFRYKILSDRVQTMIAERAARGRPLGIRDSLSAF
jgi:hypothetical protein